MYNSVMIRNKIFIATINIIPNPIIVTNGYEIVIANGNFLSFFNCKSLEEFVKYNANIENLFIKNKDYFSLDVIDDDILWTDYIYKNKNPTLVSILNKDGEPAVFEITINKLQEYEEDYVVVFTDITAIQNEKKLLEEMAYTDHLTKIYNRQMFDQLYLKELENKKRYSDALSLIMLDIDHFKSVNDTYGHDVGDKVLITLTKLITKHLRTNDIFARWGGEEFMILLPRTNIDVAYNKAQELRHLIEKYRDNTIPNITISLGVTQILNSDNELSAFTRVDKALYQAKIKRNDVAQL